MDGVILYVREALMASGMLLAAPVLIALVVALCMAAFQTVTSLQDATISLAPRLIVVGVTLGILSPWMCQQLVEYASRLFLGSVVP